MEMKRVIAQLEAATDQPLLILLYTVIAFALIVLVVAAGTYAVMCVLKKKTQMTGVMRIGIALNQKGVNEKQKVDVTVSSSLGRLDYGEYLVSMAGCPEMNPRLDWLKRADTRRYPVAAFLKSFDRSFTDAGFGDDEPAGALLKALLKDDIFCAELGTVSRRSRRRGLAGAGAAFVKDQTNGDRLEVHAKLPNRIAETFEKSSGGCKAETIGISLEYMDSLNTDEL